MKLKALKNEDFRLPAQVKIGPRPSWFGHRFYIKKYQVSALEKSGPDLPGSGADLLFPGTEFSAFGGQFYAFGGRF
jgi:hypothetical protein